VTYSVVLMNYMNYSGIKRYAFSTNAWLSIDIFLLFCASLITANQSIVARGSNGYATIMSTVKTFIQNANSVKP